MNLPSLINRRSLVAALTAAFLSGALTRVAAQEGSPATASPTSPHASPEALASESRVEFTVGDTKIIVQIADNPTSRDFLTMLPLDLAFEDFSSMEKLSYLPRELTIEGSTGHAASNGDLIYFVPWANLGFFYDAERRDQSYDDRVILIGTVETGFERLDELETGPVHVERIA